MHNFYQQINSYEILIIDFFFFDVDFLIFHVFFAFDISTNASCHLPVLFRNCVIFVSSAQHKCYRILIFQTKANLICQKKNENFRTFNRPFDGHCRSCATLLAELIHIVCLIALLCWFHHRSIEFNWYTVWWTTLWIGSTRIVLFFFFKKTETKSRVDILTFPFNVNMDRELWYFIVVERKQVVQTTAAENSNDIISHFFVNRKLEENTNNRKRQHNRKNIISKMLWDT